MLTFTRHLILAFTLGLAACSNPSNAAPPEQQAARLGAAESIQRIDAGALVVDVRTPEEFNSGHLREAVNIPHDEIGARIGELGSDRGREVVLYCRSGRRSGIAQKVLMDAGFTNTYNAGAYEELQAERSRLRQ